jgi:hypothetical protein
MGRKGRWGGREYGARAEGSMGLFWGSSFNDGTTQTARDPLILGGRLAPLREYGAQGAPRHTNPHFDPQSTTFLSPPGGIYLISTSAGVSGDQPIRPRTSTTKSVRGCPQRTRPARICKQRTIPFARLNLSGPAWGAPAWRDWAPSGALWCFPH